MKTTISGMNQSEVISGRDGELASAIKDSITGLISTALKSSPWRPSASTCPTTIRRPFYQRQISERNNIAAQYTAEGRERSADDPLRDGQRGGDHALRGQKPRRRCSRPRGEAEYMRILSDAYADPQRASFNNFCPQPGCGQGQPHQRGECADSRPRFALGADLLRRRFGSGAGGIRKDG